MRRSRDTRNLWASAPPRDIEIAPWESHPRALVKLGDAFAIEYLAKKKGDKAPVRYRHEFASDKLWLDSVNNVLVITGKHLKVTGRGIEN